MYSCRSSVYWCGKVFFALFVPADNPFWTAVENEGAWETEMNHDTVYNHFAAGSEVLLTNYPSIRASEIRARCHERVKTDWQKFRSTENYNRLSYNTAFPWQADGQKGEVAMNYLLKNNSGKWKALRLYTLKKFENGICYRDAVLETDDNMKFKLADIPLPNGILRVDKIIYDKPEPKNIEIRLGHYALPQLKIAIKDRTSTIGACRVKTIDNGIYRLAMIPWKKWSEMQFVHASGLHPTSNASAVINAFDTFRSGKKNYKFYITLLLWKKSETQKIKNEIVEGWSKTDLTPLKKVKIARDGRSVEVTFANGDKKAVKFE